MMDGEDEPLTAALPLSASDDAPAPAPANGGGGLRQQGEVYVQMEGR